MNAIRISVGNLFEAPVQNMSFVSYLAYVNTNGKITPRSLMDLITILLIHVEEQEKINEENKANFKDIEAILSKLVDKKLGNKVDEKEEELSMPHADQLHPGFICDQCGKGVKTRLALAGHSRSHKSAKV